MLITTTNVIENATIEKYHGVVSANVVVGTNMFSDFAASFTDFFGGRSETYQNKLQLIYKEVARELEQKAYRLGANSILGVKYDFDEISGKGKSMFMVSAYGTAVSAVWTEKKTNENNKVLVNYEDLKTEYIKKTLIESVSQGALLMQDYWDFLIRNIVVDVAPQLLQQYIEVAQKDQSYISTAEILLTNAFPRYFSLLPEDVALQICFQKITEYPSVIIKLIKDNQLFSSDRILELLSSGEYTIAIKLLKSYKRTYQPSDLEDLKNISKFIADFPDKGRIETTKGGLLSKGKEVYICPHGHKNDIDVEYCSQCGLNMKGLNIEEVNTVHEFNSKINILSSMFKQMH